MPLVFYKADCALEPPLTPAGKSIGPETFFPLSDSVHSKRITAREAPYVHLPTTWDLCGFGPVSHPAQSHTLGFGGMEPFLPLPMLSGNSSTPRIQGAPWLPPPFSNTGEVSTCLAHTGAQGGGQGYPYMDGWEVLGYSPTLDLDPVTGLLKHSQMLRLCPWVSRDVL